MSQRTGVDGESFPFAKKRSFWRPINATFRLKQDEDYPKWKRVLHSQVGTRSSRKPGPNDPDSRMWVECDPALQVYCDYKALTNAEGNQTPILLCAETDEEDNTTTLDGRVLSVVGGLMRGP